VYHITSRGNALKPIFKDDDHRSLFLELLRQINHGYNRLCHAYCLMSNCYHLVIETPDDNLSKGMRQLNGLLASIRRPLIGSIGESAISFCLRLLFSKMESKSSKIGVFYYGF
jgi:REP-associated tyrosine transposase